MSHEPPHVPPHELAPEPSPGPTGRPHRGRVVMQVRWSDVDLFGHVNNAAYWAVVEEDLAAAGRILEPLTAEIEHRGAAPAGPAVIRRVQDRWWICAESGAAHASIRLTMDA